MFRKSLFLFCVILVTSSFSKNVEKIFFEQCANCHGEKANEIALGMSKDISQMSEQEIIDSMIKYKNKTKAGDTMQNVAAYMEEEQFKALAKYIKSLKDR